MSREKKLPLQTARSIIKEIGKRKNDTILLDHCLRLKQVLSAVNQNKLDHDHKDRLKRLVQLLDHVRIEDISLGGVSHNFLTKLIECFPPNLARKFKGVITLDRFHISQLEHCRNGESGEESERFAIINLATRAQLDAGRVGHFVLFINMRNTYYYVDPLANPCPRTILDQIRQMNRHVLTNNCKIQSAYSVFCGLYCISFILFLMFDRHSLLVLQNFFIDEDKDGQNEYRAFSYIMRCVARF